MINHNFISTYIKLYFWLRYGLAKAINDYKRLKIRIVCIGNVWPLEG